jgi:murein hydrolase activator
MASQAQISHRWVLGLTAAALLAPPAVRSQGGEEEALAAVRREMQSLQAKLVREHADRDANGKMLVAAEQKLAVAQRELTRLRAERDRELERKRRLEQQMRLANGRLSAERAALGKQLRLSFMLGREEFTKLLLSQEDPALLGRMLVYYDYFNRARGERIGVASTELEGLRELNEESARVEDRLTLLAAEQAEQVAALGAARSERAAVVARLDESISNVAAQIDKLRKEEQRLGALIEELRAGLSDFPVTAEEPFARLKGRLAWPVAGRLASDYGQPRAPGGPTWNGVVLEAAAGTPVRAVYNGRVAFADWLPGLGLLMIIDHGDGYMSLYGHNEALLKEPGDWVTPGEAIGQVGDTGGQATAALYFEIRRDGHPINPHPWMKRAP